MKISVNWLKEFTAIDLSIDELLDRIGARLGEVESVEDLRAKYHGAIIAKVVSCIEHPNADKLHICLIDDGGSAKDVPRDGAGHIQIVCGANNIRNDQTIVWLPPGMVVPETYGTAEPLKLAVKDLRGIASNGMIASARELAFGDDHEGIVEIQDNIKPGTPLTEAYDLDDFVIEIENKMFTHRPDLFGILGIAREIAGIQDMQFKSPDWYLRTPAQTSIAGLELPLVVKNELPELVPRFMAVAMSGVTIKASPMKLQTYLARLGIRPVNNVVDVTNYMMMLTAQPLHAYDYDKVLAQDPGATAATLATRLSEKGETVLLLNGKTIEPRPEAIMITTDTKLIGLGGIMGGADTEVDSTTKNIILECANFDMYTIRRTAMTEGLFTDAVNRFNKGQSSLQNDRVLAQTVCMMRDISGAQIASRTIDDNHLKVTSTTSVTAQFISERLGLELDSNRISRTLRNVEFKVDCQEEILTVEPPFWRTDITIPEDVEEEVGRLIGYDKLPLELPKRDLKPADLNALLNLKHVIRQSLQATGACELLTYSFVHGNLINKAGQNQALAFQLSNALSPDLQYYRLSILPSLLEKVHPNIKAGFHEFALYELGKVHIKDWLDDEQLPKEEERLALVFAADSKSAEIYDGAAYYQASYCLKDLLTGFSIQPVFGQLPPQAALKVNEQMVAPFEVSRAALVTDLNSGELLGVVGELKTSVRQAFKLPEFTAGFEIDLAKIFKLQKTFSGYTALSRYPRIEQDISLKVSNEISYGQLYDLVFNGITDIKPDQTYFDLKPLDIYRRSEDQDHKQITFRLNIASYKETMKADEINQLLDAVAAVANQKVGATRL